MAVNRYYSCPYCNKKFTKENLPAHLEKNHIDELPEEFTPLRMTFHIVNNKPVTYRRPCRICKQGTDWDENKGRYNFLCNKKSCHDAWVEQMKKIMGDKMGINRQTSTPEGLEKMLANRKISGKYKFQDGSEKVYTGSYEKKALEFLDKVMNIKSEDLMCPGPILKYSFLSPNAPKEKPADDKTDYNEYHIYIPDMYYIPYNLLIEVKDGGNRPNKNESLAATRKRQIAKEKFIIENTDYNYLRLTDNDFSQLLSVFADLKIHLIESNNERVIHVNEAFISNKKNFSYVKLSNPKDIEDFCRYMKIVFNSKTNANDKSIKNMKAIKYNNKIIGYIGFNRYTIKKKKYLGFGNFMILPEYQNSGYGSDIVADIIEKNKSNYDEIYCYVDKNNTKAISFYKKIASVNTSNETKYGYYVTIYKKDKYIEESVKSNIDLDFKKKGDIKLSSLSKKKLDNDIIEKYKDQYKFLSHIRIKNTDGYLYFDNDNLVACISVESKENDEKWIQALEVTNDYQGYGLSKQLLDVCVKELGANFLSVNKTNEVAHKIYLDYGFKVYKETDSMYFMSLKSITENYFITKEDCGEGYLPGLNSPGGVYIINYLQNNVFSEPDFAIADSPKLQKMIVKNKDNILKEVDSSFLYNARYSIYFVETTKEVINIIAENIEKEVSDDFIYETIFGHKKYSDDQILFEETAKPCKDFYETLQEDENSLIKYFKEDK